MASSCVHLAKNTDKKSSSRAEYIVFVGYTQTTKQYRLYNPTIISLVISQDLVFHEDTSYFRPTDHKIFLPFTNEPDISPETIEATSAVRKVRAPLPPLPARWLRGTPESLARKERIKQRRNAAENRNITGNGRWKWMDNEVAEPNLGHYWRVGDESTNDRVETGEPSTVSRRSRQSSMDIQNECNHPVKDDMNFGIDYTFMVANGPTSISATLSGPDRKEWVKAINSELDWLETHGTWLVESNVNQGVQDLQTILSRMVLQEMFERDGSVARFKARLVAVTTLR